MTLLILTPDPTAGIDTLLNDGSVATWNYGVRTTFSAGHNSGSAKSRSLIKFDLSALSVDSTITSATLSLYCTSQSSGTDYDVFIHRSLVQWYEGSQTGGPPSGGQDGSTWNLRNANGSVAWVGGAGGVSGSDWDATASDAVLITGTGIYHDWDVTADIQDFVDGVNTNHGWWVLGDETLASTLKSFATSDNATEIQRPTLTIDYFLPDTDMFGESAGVATVTGTMDADGMMAAAASGVATVTGSLVSNQIFGAVAGTSTITGNLQATATLEGSVAGTSTAVGNLSGPADIEGSASGIATVSGFGGFEGQLRGTILGIATVTATGLVLARHVIRARGCFTDPLLYITNGTIKNSGQFNRMDLINPAVGYILNKWRPTIAQYKAGGTWSESSRGTGRRLTNRIFGNAIEVFELKARSYTQDDLFQYTHEYFAWQEEAADFWVSDWASIPVYLVAKGPRESNPRYAIIYAMSIPELENPYEQPLYGIKNAVLEQLTLRLERGDWMSQPPGQSECVAISSVRSWTIAGWSTGS